MLGKKQYNFLDCLPEFFAPHKGSIELLVAETLAQFSSRLEPSLLNEIATPHGRPSSVTTSMNRAASIPEALSLDGLPQDNKGDLSKQLISVQVREFHIVDNDATPSVLYTVTSAFAGGYHATVYRMQQDIDALHKLFGRRAQTEPFTAPAVGDSKALHKSCASLRTYLLRILRCPAAIGNKDVFAWFGLDRAFATTREDEILGNAFDDVWRKYYSDEERLFTDSPEDTLTMYVTGCVKKAHAACFAEVKKQGGQAAEFQSTKCVMLYVRQCVRRTWTQWRASTPVLCRKFALLPDGEFAGVVDEALADAKKPLTEAIAPFTNDAVPAVKAMLGVITPLAKAVRHTMREYRPRKRATMMHLLAAQPGEVAEYKFDNLESKLARVKGKVKGALEFAARTYEKELPLNVKAEGEDSVNAQLLPFMRKIPTLARAFFYLVQPSVVAAFTKNFLHERERLCAIPPSVKAKDRSPIDVFASRMTHVLSFIERDLSFSDFCVKSDFTDEVFATHHQDGTLPCNSRFAVVLRALYSVLSRLVTLKMQFFVNMTKIFVNTVNDMGLDAVMSPQLRIAMVRSASQTAYVEANAVYERQLARFIPEVLVDLVTALLTTPALEAMEKARTLQSVELAVSRNRDPAFNAFLDVANLVNMAVTCELREAVEKTVTEWWSVSMNHRAYDPARTAAVVAKRKDKKKAMSQEEPAEEEADDGGKKKKKKKDKKKKKKKNKEAAEGEEEPDAVDDEGEGKKKKKKKKKKNKEAVAAE